MSKQLIKMLFIMRYLIYLHILSKCVWQILKMLSSDSQSSTETAALFVQSTSPDTSVHLYPLSCIHNHEAPISSYRYTQDGPGQLWALHALQFLEKRKRKKEFYSRN